MGPLPVRPWDVQVRRAMYVEMSKALRDKYGKVDLTGVKKTTIQIPMRDGTSIDALLYQPENSPAKPGPLSLWIHGGGASRLRQPKGHALTVKINKVGLSAMRRCMRRIVQIGSKSLAESAFRLNTEWLPNTCSQDRSKIATMLSHG